MEYIHYGTKVFDLAKFRPIKNRPGIGKPFGGFWASPINAKTGWKEWCDQERFMLCEDSNSIRFVLDDRARVLHIRNTSDLVGLPSTTVESNMRWLYGSVYLDFEGLVKMGYDAVELHLSEDGRLYNELYGWDVDSLLVFNPKIIQEIPEVKEEAS